jgi:hypothetical protein
MSRIVDMETGARGSHDVTPRGIEVMIKKAAVDVAFREILLERRSEAAREIGLTLLASEVAMLNATPRSQLETIIASTRVEPRLRPALLGRAAAVMLVALGVGLAGCDDRRRPEPTKGISPDRPLRPPATAPGEKAVPASPVADASAPAEPEKQPPSPGATRGIQPDRPPVSQGMRSDRPDAGN